MSKIGTAASSTHRKPGRLMAVPDERGWIGSEHDGSSSRVHSAIPALPVT